MTWQLSGSTKVVMSLITLLGVGTGVGAHLEQAADTRQRVIAQGATLATVVARADTLRHDVSGIRRLLTQQLCLTIAEREHTDWRRCLTPEE